jgi:hypothetical protein
VQIIVEQASGKIRKNLVFAFLSSKRISGSSLVILTGLFAEIAATGMNDEI